MALESNNIIIEFMWRLNDNRKNDQSEEYIQEKLDEFIFLMNENEININDQDKFVRNE